MHVLNQLSVIIFQLYVFIFVHVISKLFSITVSFYTHIKSDISDTISMNFHEAGVALTVYLLGWKQRVNVLHSIKVRPVQWVLAGKDLVYRRQTSESHQHFTVSCGHDMQIYVIGLVAIL